MRHAAMSFTKLDEECHYFPKDGGFRTSLFGKIYAGGRASVQTQGSALRKPVTAKAQQSFQLHGRLCP